MDRVKTFIQGFDEALGGGIPRGHVVLMSGSPGTMKTSVTFSILYNNVKAGSKGLAAYFQCVEGEGNARATMIFGVV